jgi:hypothetical protein
MLVVILYLLMSDALKKTKTKKTSLIVQLNCANNIHLSLGTWWKAITAHNGKTFIRQLIAIQV